METCPRISHFLFWLWDTLVWIRGVEDRKILSTVFNTMLSHNVENCVDLLREFDQYKSGPAGRGKGVGLGACNGRPSQCNSRDNITSLVTTIINDHLAENTDPNKVRIRSCCTLQAGRSDRYTPCLFLSTLFSWHRREQIASEPESQMEPMVSSPSSSRDIAQDDTARNIHAKCDVRGARAAQFGIANWCKWDNWIAYFIGSLLRYF